MVERYPLSMTRPISTASKANLTIDATTVDTRNENRDKDLEAAKFFDVEKFPTITFVSKKCCSAGLEESSS